MAFVLDIGGVAHGTDTQTLQVSLGLVDSGQFIIITGIVGKATGPGSVTVTDTLGTIYTVNMGALTQDGKWRSFVAYGKATSSSTNAVTVNAGSVNHTISIGVQVWDGVHAVPLDVDGGDAEGSGTIAPRDTITPTSDGALLIGVASATNQGPITADAPLTLIVSRQALTVVGSPLFHRFNAAYRIIQTPATFALSWQLNFGELWSAQTIAFKPADPDVEEPTTRVGRDFEVLWSTRERVGRFFRILFQIGVLDFPDELPAPLIQHTRRIQNHNRITEFETSRKRKRRMFDEERELWQVQWNFTDDEFEVFKAFFDEDLRNGELGFELEVFEQPRQVEFFDAAYSMARSDNLHQVNAVLLVEPLDITIIVDDFEDYADDALVDGLDGGDEWGTPNPYIARANYYGVQAFDDMEEYDDFDPVDGLDEGWMWGDPNPYQDIANNLGVQAWDDMESYADAAEVDDLNGGDLWIGPYFDLENYTGVKAYDDMELYNDSDDVDGLNGGVGFVGAYNE